MSSGSRLPGGGGSRRVYVAMCVLSLALAFFLLDRDCALLPSAWCGRGSGDGTDDGGAAQRPGLTVPKPVWDARTVNKLNSWTLSGGGRRRAVTFIVVIRTYSGFQDATRQLLENLDKQRRLAELDIALHAVVLSTDWNSTSLLSSLVASGAYRSSEFSNVQVHFHALNESLYGDNCCQLREMCTSKIYHEAWTAHVSRRYGNYKAATLKTKMSQFCDRGNNLLHYVLCDAALAYLRSDSVVPPDQANSTFVLLTNGDNAYSLDFVWRMVTSMTPSRTGGRGGSDLAMCDYLERGVQLVHTKLRVNQMDLGATVYRLASLRRLGVGFLDALPAVAWPSHYYAADGEFTRFLVERKRASWTKVDEVLFSHF